MIYFIYKEAPFIAAAENGSKKDLKRSAGPSSYPSGVC